MRAKDITMTICAGWGPPDPLDSQFSPDQYGSYLGATGEQIRITLEWLAASVHPRTRKNFADVLYRVMELDTRAQENENVARSLREHGYARTSWALAAIDDAGFEDAFRELNERMNQHPIYDAGFDAPPNRHERRRQQRTHR